MKESDILLLEEAKKSFSRARNVILRIKEFSIQRYVLKLLIHFTDKIDNQKLKDFFCRKLQEIDDVKDNVITKYIVKELFLYFIVSFLFFFMVFFVNQILLYAETILKKRAPIHSVMSLIWYSLPGVIAQSAPFATLVGFLMCLGRMVTDNEILILRASGQRYIRILKPVIFLGIIISIFSFFVNDYLLPVGTLKRNRIYRQIITSNPTVELESHSIKRMNDSTIVIGEVKEKHVSDLVIFDTDENNNQRIIFAKDSDVLNTTNPGVLMQINMNNSLVMMLKDSKKENFDVINSQNMKLNIFESSLITSEGTISPSEMTSYDLAKRIKDMKKRTNKSKRELNTNQLELNKKFSVPFGSFFFALLALPLALIFGKKDGQTLGLIFGLIISVLYWAATILGQMFGVRSGYNGFIMMWTPNLFIGMIGILLYFKLVKK